MLSGLLRDWWRRLQDGGPAAPPGDALVLYREGVAFEQDSRLDEAEQRYRRALLADPGLAEASNNLGRIHEMRGRNAEADACYRCAIACKPSLPQPYVNLGNLLQRRNDLDAACEHYRAALARDPANREAQNNLANILLERGEHKAARAAFADAVRLSPDDPVAASNKLSFENYVAGSPPQLVFQEHLDWGKRFADPLAAAMPEPTNAPDPERRLRLGYISPDFRQHAMAFFIEPLLEFCDAAQFDVVCYNNWPRPDAMTAHFKALACDWRDIAFLSDLAVAQQIAADGIDLLVDLAGHTSENRLLVLARKPAPLQLTYLGYVNTTGVAAIDYRITDAWADPPQLADANYTERLLRLPDSLFCYRAPDSMPDVGALPALRNGYPSFGSFNNFVKITDDVIETWATLLERVPQSRLIMLSVARGETQRRVAAAFADRGIDAQRLELLPRLPMDDYLALHNRVDIALDPFPFNGGTTTCHALWMGVPTVTLAGQVSAARAGLSLLTCVGLPMLVASDVEAYLQIAANLASDLPRLSALRSGLRERMRASPLCDAPRFVANLESLYRDAWRQWCAHRGRQGAAPQAVPSQVK